MLCGDSRPSQIQLTPSSISSRIEYFAIAFADENTYIVHALRPRFMHSSSSIARGRSSRKFSSIMKNDCTPSAASASHIAR